MINCFTNQARLGCAGLALLLLSSFRLDANETERLYRVGVLYGEDSSVVAHWQAGAAKADTRFAMRALSYEDAVKKPDELMGLDCLVLADSPLAPAELQLPLGQFARKGGDLILVGGLPFSGSTTSVKAFTDLAFSPASRYRYKGDFSVRPWGDAGVVLPNDLNQANLTARSGWSAIGFSFPQQSQFHPLLEIVDNKGRREAWAMGLLKHRENEFSGGTWLLAGIEGADFYRSPSMLGWMLATVRGYTPPPQVTRALAAKPTVLPSGRIKINSVGAFELPEGNPFFIIGANYCGPFELKLEKFFSQDNFSAEILDAEFAKLQGVGINVLRSFSFGRLQTLEATGNRVQAIRDSAQRHGIYLMPEIGLKGITAGPYDLEDNVKHAAAVARAYRGEVMLLGYDLCNEPYLTEVGSMTFHGQPCPLVKLKPYENLAHLMHPKMKKDWIDRQMIKTDGWMNLPVGLPLETKRQLLASVSIWIGYLDQNGGKNSTFPGMREKINLSDTGPYEPFLAALNETFQIWIDELSAAIHGEDPGALITVGYNTALVALPVNETLDFLNNHIYQKPFTYKDTEISLGTFDRLKQMFPGKPITLGEFGLSNGLVLNGAPANYQTQALWETLHYLYPYAHGMSGSMKWMDNDWTTPYITRYARWWTDPTTLAYEEQFGLFAFDGTPQGAPKPIAWCTRFFSEYLKTKPIIGTLRTFEAKNQVRVGFEYKAENAWFYGGENFSNDCIRWINDETKVVMVNATEQAIKIMSTVDLELEINTAAIALPVARVPVKTGPWIKLKLLRGEPLTLPR